MTCRPRLEIRVYEDVDRLSAALAERIARLADRAVRDQGRFSLALSGGNTPRPLYRLLASAYRERIPWGAVHAFWGDERYVPPDDPRSDYRMARETLLDHVPIPPDHVHPFPTLLPRPEEAAQAYERTLRSHFSGCWPRFDLILLGLGPEGHTASLFPGSPALGERARWVTAARVRADPPLRLTLTLPAINHAAHIDFLVVGEEKAAAVAAALAERPDVNACPAAGVWPSDGKLIWWLDEGAAKALDGS
jgi:6-phosphogluconolactonase